MKELNDQTVLVENGENKNDSYRQKTKYDDRVDSYFSTYDLGILLQNRDSYLEGKLDSNGDVDCYSFSYAQKKFYDKMGIGTKVTVRLENIPEGCEYNLVIYDVLSGFFCSYNSVFISFTFVGRPFPKNMALQSENSNR